MALNKLNRVSILGNPTQNSATLEEVVKAGGGSGEGVTEQEMNTAISAGVAPKADKTYVDTELAKKPSKSEVDTSIDSKVSQLGATLGTELEEFDQRKANINEVVTSVNGGSGSITVNKSTVGLGNVNDVSLPDPKDLVDGATLVSKDGKWVVVLPPVEEI